jgi:hypothetical protein
MGSQKMRKSGQSIFVTGVVLFILMLSSLLMMSNALQDSSHFSDFYLGLLIFNTLGLVILVVLITLNLKRLIKQLRNRIAGARMTIRMVSMFTVLSVTPVLVVYYFSLDFLIRGIDNWFDLRVEQALNDSLELSRQSLDTRMRDLLRRTRQMADELSDITDAAIPFEIDAQRNLRSSPGRVRSFRRVLMILFIWYPTGRLKPYCCNCNRAVAMPDWMRFVIRVCIFVLSSISQHSAWTARAGLSRPCTRYPRGLTNWRKASRIHSSSTRSSPIYGNS